MTKKCRHSSAGMNLEGTSKGLVFNYIFAVLFFLVTCLAVPDSIKTLSIVMVAAVLVAVVLRFSVLKERIGAPMLALVLVTLMGGISTFYAVSTKFALAEFLKILVAFCGAILLLAFAPRKEGSYPARWTATILEGAGALAGLVSIDLLSTRIISTPVLSLFGLFSSAYEKLAIVEPGVRMISIFANPNIFAGSMGIAVLLSLALVTSSEKTGERRVHLCLLFLNSLAFLLAFSMGASASIAVAFVIYLILERKECRGRLFALMLETLVLVVFALALISKSALSVWTGINPLPLLSIVLGAAVLCLLDEFVALRIVSKMKGKSKLALILIAVLLVIVILFLAVALTFTGPATLNAGESLRRAAYPEPGTYTMSSIYEGDVSVTIESQNKQDTMMHTSTILFNGLLSEAAFTVPDDSLVVYFNFYSAHGATLETASYCVGDNIAHLPLDYKLLPGFIATRLQGLFANENAIQRFVFFEDGLKLFAKNPLFGRGLGAFENGIKSVQSFYYETKYAHNHYVQTLAETGVVGIVLFIGLLAISALAIWRERRREDGHIFAPVLGAALVFMVVHAATEMVFSAYSYLPSAFGLFALINLCCGHTIPLTFYKEAARKVTLFVLAALLTVYAVLVAGVLMADSNLQRNPTFDTLAQCAKLDRFEWSDYMLTYVSNADDMEIPERIRTQADEFALRLAELDSNSIPRYLAKYYFNTGRTEQALAMLEKYVDYVSSDYRAWENTFAMLQAFEEDSTLFRDGVARLNAMMVAWDEQNVGTITISESTQAFINRICG